MHELSLCQNLIAAVERIARRENATSVRSLTVSVGALCGVEPTSLAQAFEIARAGTVAHDAQLHLQSAPVRVACETCGAQSEVPVQRLLCSCCGGWRVRLLAGEELLLTRVEIERKATSADPAADFGCGTAPKD